MEMTLVVTRKEIKNIIRNKGLIFSGLWFGCMFGILNVLFGGQNTFSNTVYSVALLVVTFVGYSFSSFIFLREKRDKIIEALLCTPLSLRSIWLGKVLGAAVISYLFSLFAVTLVTLISSIMMHYLLLPSIAILIHIAFVVPIFTTATIGLMGFFQFVFGMRENKVVGYLIVLILMPFIYPSIFGLILGDVNTVISWFEVGLCSVFAVFLLALTIYLSKYLSKEKIVTTIPSV
jgi:ABC-2 type transport system permease protein